MLKRCVAAIAAALIFSVGHTAPLSAEDLEECKGFAKIARSLMNLRQDGVPMSDLMEFAMAQKDPDLQGIFQIYVELVFEYPLYTTPDAKSRAVSEFDSFVYKGCLKSLK
ncbi:hypothetical protein D3C71_1678280 [compost metagenome]